MKKLQVLSYVRQHYVPKDMFEILMVIVKVSITNNQIFEVFANSKYKKIDCNQVKHTACNNKVFKSAEVINSYCEMQNILS